MKQAIIVLTLWILSSYDAHSQSMKLEEYTRNDAMMVSAKQPKALISRQPMADLDPHSLLVKTESSSTPAPVAVEKRSAGNTDKALSENTKALWANTQALAENTRALDDNTKAIKENTAMLRKLLQAIEAPGYAGRITKEQIYMAALAPAKTNIPVINSSIGAGISENVVPAEVSKPTTLAANTNARPVPAEITAAVEARKEQHQLMLNAPINITTPAALIPGSGAIASVTIPANLQPAVSTKSAPSVIAKPKIFAANTTLKQPANQAKITNQAIKQQAAVNASVKLAIPQSSSSTKAIKPQAFAANTTSYTIAAHTVATTKIPSHPQICFLNGTTNTLDNTTAQLYAASAKASPKLMAFAANTDTKQPAHKLPAPSVLSIKPQLSNTSKKADVVAMHDNASSAKITPKPLALHASTEKPPLQKAIVPIVTLKPHAHEVVTKATTDVFTISATRLVAKPSVNKPLATTIDNAIKPKAPKPAIAALAVKTQAPTLNTKTPEKTNVAINSLPLATVSAKKTLPGNTVKQQLPKAATLVALPNAKINIKPVIYENEKPGEGAGKRSATKYVIKNQPKPTHGAAATAKFSVGTAIATGMIAKKNKKVSLGYLLQFPLLDRSFDNQVRASKHVPTYTYSGFKEGDMITTHGYISLISIEDSGKQEETYYIQLVTNPYLKDSCINLRVTTDRFAGEARQQLTANARKFLREQLLNGNAPSHSGNVMNKPVFVTVTGQLVYNSALAGAMRGPHPLYIGKKGVRSYTPWEISNVVRIDFSME